MIVFLREGNNIPHRRTCLGTRLVFWDSWWPYPWLGVDRGRQVFSRDGWEWRVPYCWGRRIWAITILRRPWSESRCRCPFAQLFKQRRGSVHPEFYYAPEQRQSPEFCWLRLALKPRCHFSVTQCKLCSLPPGCRQDSFFKLYLKFKIYIPRTIITYHS